MAEVEGGQSAEHTPAYLQARVGRLVESIVRALLVGAPLEECSAAGLAQHWVIATATPIGLRAGLVEYCRMLVPLARAARIESLQRHPNSRLAGYLVEHLRGEWKDDQGWCFWVKLLIPMAIELAWERRFLATTLEDLAVRVGVLATENEGTQAGEAWTALMEAIREESGEHREVEETDAASVLRFGNGHNTTT